jgi:hypothetical protein
MRPNRSCPAESRTNNLLEKANTVERQPLIVPLSKLHMKRTFNEYAPYA